MDSTGYRRLPMTDLPWQISGLIVMRWSKSVFMLPKAWHRERTPASAEKPRRRASDGSASGR
jgi:hypothetical protein